MPTGSYTIDATNNTEPLDSRYVADFPAELRAMKTRMNNAISDLGSLTGALMTDGSNYMVGNLGVGAAASGGYKLDVNGNTRNTGTLAIVGKVTASSTGFAPSSASISNAAVTVSGASGGGLVMVDGTVYGSVHLTSENMKLGIGTSAGVTDKVSVESTVLKYLGATTAELQATPANGYAAARLLATGTNSSYLFFDNAVSGERARFTADNAANLYAAVGSSATLSQIWYSDRKVGFYGDEVNIGLGQSATQKRLLFNSSARIVQLGLNTDNSVSLYDNTTGTTRWASDTAGNFTVTGALTSVGVTTSEDIKTYRAATPTTGYVFLNSAATRYVGFDGTNYVMAGANLVVNGSSVVKADGGTYSLSISGNAATATTATSATSATTATTAVGLQSSAGSAPHYSCRAWVDFDGTGATSANQTIRSAGNVSSVYKNDTGDYTINLTTAMPSSAYAVMGSGDQNGTLGMYPTVISRTTSSVRVKFMSYDTVRDVSLGNIVICG